MITETETAFLAVVRAFLTEEKAALEELAALTEKQWNHLFVLAAQHSLLSAVYDVVGKTPEFAELPDELRRQVKTQAMQSILQQVSRTALFLTDEKELEQLGVQPLVMKGIEQPRTTACLANNREYWHPSLPHRKSRNRKNNLPTQSEERISQTHSHSRPHRNSCHQCGRRYHPLLFPTAICTFHPRYHVQYRTKTFPVQQRKN